MPESTTYDPEQWKAAVWIRRNFGVGPYRLKILVIEGKVRVRFDHTRASPCSTASPTSGSTSRSGASKSRARCRSWHKQRATAKLAAQSELAAALPRQPHSDAPGPVRLLRRAGAFALSPLRCADATSPQSVRFSGAAPMTHADYFGQLREQRRKNLSIPATRSTGFFVRWEPRGHHTGGFRLPNDPQEPTSWYARDPCVGKTAPFYPVCTLNRLDLLSRGFWPVAIYPQGIKLKGRRKPTKGKAPIGTAWGAKQRTERNSKVISSNTPNVESEPVLDLVEALAARG